MPTIQSLKKEIDSLKEQNKITNEWITYLQKNQDGINKRIFTIEKGSTPVISKNKEIYKQDNSMLLGGIIFIIIGGLLCLTIIGAIIGVPLFILGLFLASKSSKGTMAEVKGNAKPIKVKKQVKIEKVIQPKAKKEKISFEEDVGMKWFARVGILALVVGIGFFIKYAIDMNWISHLARIIMGVSFGIALIVFGEIVSKKEKYANWAKTLIGGGFAITYFVTFAAYHFKEYQTAIGISRTLDIVLLSLIVIFAILFSLRDNSQIIAAESFFLGYITSLLNNHFGFMAIVYSLLLTIGLVIVVSYKKWSVIGLGGVGISYLVYMQWTMNNPDSFMYSSFILISFFIAFTIQSFFLVKKKEIFDQNIAIILINSSFFFILYYFQIEKYYPDYTGLFTLIFSVIYFIAYFISQLLKEDKFAITHLYLALLYITLTIPIQLNNKWITIVWALETLILTILFLKLKINTLKIGSYIVGIITAFKTLTYDINYLDKFVAAFKTFIYDITFLDKFNLVNKVNDTRLFSFLVTIICFYLIYKLLKKNKEMLPEDEFIIPLLYSWAASSFLIIIIFLELIKNSAVWISIILSIIALIYIMVSNADKKEIFYQSIAISIILFFKVLIYDSWYLNDFNANNLLLSTRLFAFIIPIFTFYIISWFLDNKKEILDKSEFILINIFSYAGTFLSFVLIMIEMEEFWISIGWSILALIIMISGFMFRKKHLRMQGMLIFSIIIAKVFLYDTRNLETIYRTISYIVLGVILLLVSFIYTKYKDKLKEIL